MNNNSFNITTICSLCIMLVGCGQSKKMNPNMAHGTSGVELYNQSYSSTYTVVLNGEPVNWADGASHTLVHGYPMRHGTNQIEVALIFPQNFKDMQDKRNPVDIPRVSMQLQIQEAAHGPLIYTNWETVDICNEWANANKPFEWNSKFLITNNVENLRFEKLGTNTQHYVEQCKKMSVKLARLVQKQDYDQLAVVFGLTNRTDVKTSIPPGLEVTRDSPRGVKVALLDNCPGLIYRVVNTNEVTVTGVTDVSQLVTVNGKCLILIHSKKGIHLASFIENNVKERWAKDVFAKLRHLGVFNVDSFVFGRVGGKWKVACNGGGWLGNHSGWTAIGNGWLDVNL